MVKRLSQSDQGNSKITNLANPTNPQDAATKAYVDTNAGGSGDVTGPASATDNAIVRFDGTTGKAIQNSYATLSDTGFLQTTQIYASGSIAVDPIGVFRTDSVSEYTVGAGITIDGVLIKDGLVDGVDVSALGTGTGDVVGPTSSTDSRLAAFDGTTGKLLKDSGYSAGAIFTYIDDEVAGKADASHTHSTTDLTATGGSSTSFLRKDNTWATPTNTTYSEISEANIENTTSSTVGLITGRRAEALMDNEASKARTLSNKTIDATSNTISNVASLSVKRQDNTTNSTVNGVRIETGWGYELGQNTFPWTAGKTVTFSIPFSSKPVVIVSSIGYKDSSNPADVGDFNPWEVVNYTAGSIATTGFTAKAYNTQGGNIASTRRVGYSWIAIGA